MSLKKVTELPLLEQIDESDHILVDHGGEAKRVSASSMGVTKIPVPTADDAGKVPTVKQDGSGYEFGHGGGAQADWNVTDETDPAFIVNKPFGKTRGGVVKFVEYGSTSTTQDTDGRYVFTFTRDDVCDIVGPVNIEIDGTTYENITFDAFIHGHGTNYTFDTDGLPFTLYVENYYESEYPSTITVTYIDSRFSYFRIIDMGAFKTCLLSREYLDVSTDSIRGLGYIFPVCDRLSYTLDKMHLVYNSTKGMFEPTYDMYLKSSTSGSSKKFKITVDDSGTISATEVT